MEIKNARIISTKLSCEEGGLVGFCITLEAANNVKYKFSSFEIAKDAAVILNHIFDVVGVYYWEDLPNKYARIQYNPDRCVVEAIGNLIEEKWFNIKEYFADKEG